MLRWANVQLATEPPRKYCVCIEVTDVLGDPPRAATARLRGGGGLGARPSPGLEPRRARPW